MPLVASGCRPAAQDGVPGWQIITESRMTTEQTVQRERALAARDAMFATLKDRLMEVVGSEGPAAAIAVCAREAPEIAERIAREHRLSIRRTSWRLRNPKNSPPEWAEPLVSQRVAEPTYLTRDGQLAALLPIRLLGQCLMCHGPTEFIPEPVREELAEHYPEDQATGFQEGDLRGWFCIEVPAE
jgi:hypothetical protein